MKWLILALIILAQQPAKAPERKGASKGVVTQDAQQSDAANNNKGNPDAPPPMSVRQIPATEPKTKAAKTENDMPQKGADWIEIFTGLLVFVGFLQTGVMYLTWRVYRRQAHEMKRQRSYMQLQWQAMRGQLEAQKESLRARLTIAFDGSPFRALMEGHVPRMVAKLVNTGGTPAHNVIPESWIEFLPIPFVDFTPAALYFKGEEFSIYPTQPITYPVQLDRHLTALEITNMRTSKGALCLRIRLSYETFGTPRHCDLAFVSEPNGIAQLGKYHDAN